MLAQAGIALGITLATLGQQWRTAVHYAVLQSNVHPGNAAFDAVAARLRDALAPQVGSAVATRIAVAHIAQMAIRQSSLLAHIDHFRAVAVLGALGVVVTLTQRVLR